MSGPIPLPGVVPIVRGNWVNGNVLVGLTPVTDSMKHFGVFVRQSREQYRCLGLGQANGSMAGIWESKRQRCPVTVMVIYSSFCSW